MIETIELLTGLLTDMLPEDFIEFYCNMSVRFDDGIRNKKTPEAFDVCGDDKINIYLSRKPEICIYRSEDNSEYIMHVDMETILKEKKEKETCLKISAQLKMMISPSTIYFLDRVEITQT